MAEIEVPQFFLCPISLEIMEDPVALNSGITYDRASIERWIFSSSGDHTCPVTKQHLTDLSLTPNVTLRSVIQSWCTQNDVQRLPTPKSPVTKSQILKILREAKSPEMQIRCLKKLKSISRDNESNKRCMEMVGVAEFLASLINSISMELLCLSKETQDSFDLIQAREEAFSILFTLQLSEKSLGFLSNSDFIGSIVNSMKNGSFESRACSIMLLNQILEVTDPDPSLFIVLHPEFFVEIARVLKDQISPKASKSALKVLMFTLPWGRNRIKAAESGTVHILIELLLDSPEKRACEMMLAVLDLLCQCAEGRAELLKHGAGLAIVSKKILRVSKVASEKAVKILHSISRFSSTPGVVQEMLQMGVANKLCLAVHVDSGSKTQERSWEMLKMHYKSWKNSPCLQHNHPISMFSS